MLFVSVEGVLEKKSPDTFLCLSPLLQTWPGLGAGAQTHPSECGNVPLQCRNRGARGLQGWRRRYISFIWGGK